MKFDFNPLFPDATNEEKWQQIRLWRNAELTRTDWTQLEDAQVDKNAWAQYRQDLRDLPTRYEIAEEVVMPSKPSGTL